MRRILLDQGLSPSAAVTLRADGWDAVHVLDVGLDRAEDLQILSFAQREDRTCVTLDHDFHAHLAILRSAGPSVVLIRIEGLKALGQVRLIRSVWETCEKDLAAGAAVSVDEKTIRVRKLPLRQSS